MERLVRPPVAGLEKVHEVLQELLWEVLDALQQAEVAHWIDHGTLLGCLRHESIIPWDDDVDVSALAEDRERVRAILRRTSAASQRRLEEYGNHFKYCARRRRAGWGPKHGWHYTPHVDVFFYCGIAGVVRALDLYAAWHVWDEELRSLVRHPFYGRDVPIPAAAEAMMARHYGASWRTEEHRYRSGQEDNYYRSHHRAAHREIRKQKILYDPRDPAKMAAIRARVGPDAKLVTGRVLDVRHGNIAGGAALIMHPFHGRSNQRFYFGRDEMLQCSGKPGVQVDVRDGQLRLARGSSCGWRFVADAGPSCGRLQHVRSGWYAAVERSKLVLVQDAGSAALVELHRDADTVVIEEAHPPRRAEVRGATPRALDVRRRSVADGTDLILYARHGLWNQRFTYVDQQIASVRDGRYRVSLVDDRVVMKWNASDRWALERLAPRDLHRVRHVASRRLLALQGARVVATDDEAEAAVFRLARPSADELIFLEAQDDPRPRSGHVVAILLASGQGTRAAEARPKQFWPVLGRPVIYYTLSAFHRSPAVDHVILVVPAESVDEMRDAATAWGIDDCTVIAGGQTRQESVRAAHRLLVDGAVPADLVVVHDGVRPLVGTELIGEVVDAAFVHGAAGCVRPLVSTVIAPDPDGFLGSSLARSAHAESHTPQAFSRDVFDRMYTRISDDALAHETECLALALRYADARAKLIETDGQVTKITYREDMYTIEHEIRRRERNVVLVTGGTRGIGRSVAARLVAQGFSVVVCGRDVDSLERARSELGCDAIRCDVSDDAAVVDMFAQIRERHGSLYALVNNAGEARLAAVDETSIDDWRSTFRTNVDGAFLCCREAVKLMKQGSRGGAVVNIGSSSIDGGRVGQAAYCSSKAALKSLTETIAQEGRSHGIHAWYVVPRRTATEMRRELFPDEDPREQLDPDDVADHVYFVLAAHLERLSGASLWIR